jgi:mRNA-degrading endonuclease RelE of RelBE toxin-antitoxin system
MRAAPMTVVETPLFLRKAALLSEGERAELLAFLGSNPEAGSVIPETGGIRKIRWAAPGRGKRGGFRVIYYFHDENFPLFLLTMYAKNQQANLTKAERNDWKKFVGLLVKTYAKGRHL